LPELQRTMAYTGRLSILVSLFLVVLVASAPSNHGKDKEEEKYEKKSSGEKGEDDEVAVGKEEEKEETTKSSSDEKQPSDDDEKKEDEKKDEMEDLEMPYTKTDEPNDDGDGKEGIIPTNFPKDELRFPIVKDSIPHPGPLFPSPWGPPHPPATLTSQVLDKAHGKEMIDLMILKLQKMNSFLEGVVSYWDEWAEARGGLENNEEPMTGMMEPGMKSENEEEKKYSSEDKEPSDKMDDIKEVNKEEEMPYKPEEDVAEETKGSGEKEEDGSDKEKEKEEKEDKDDEKENKDDEKEEKDVEKDEKEVPPSDRVMGEQYFDYYNGKH